MTMANDSMCDYPGCGNKGEIISRLSPEGYLVATGKKAYSFREKPTEGSTTVNTTMMN